MTYAELYENLVKGGASRDTAAALVDQQVAADARAPKVPVKRDENWYEAVVVATNEKVAVNVHGNRVRVMNDVKVPTLVDLATAKATLRTVKVAGKPVVSNGNWASKWDMWFNN